MKKQIKSKAVAVIGICLSVIAAAILNNPTLVIVAMVAGIIWALIFFTTKGNEYEKI